MQSFVIRERIFIELMTSERKLELMTSERKQGFERKDPRDLKDLTIHVMSPVRATSSANLFFLQNLAMQITTQFGRTSNVTAFA